MERNGQGEEGTCGTLGPTRGSRAQRALTSCLWLGHWRRPLWLCTDPSWSSGTGGFIGRGTPSGKDSTTKRHLRRRLWEWISQSWKGIWAAHYGGPYTAAGPALSGPPIPGHLAAAEQSPGTRAIPEVRGWPPRGPQQSLTRGCSPGPTHCGRAADTCLWQNRLLQNFTTWIKNNKFSLALRAWNPVGLKPKRGKPNSIVLRRGNSTNRDSFLQPEQHTGSGRPATLWNRNLSAAIGPQRGGRGTGKWQRSFVNPRALSSRSFHSTVTHHQNDASTQTWAAKKFLFQCYSNDICISIIMRSLKLLNYIWLPVQHAYYPVYFQNDVGRLA